MPQPSNRAREYKEVGIFLAPEFSIYVLVPIIEMFRVANHLAGRRLFNWRFISETGGPVESGSGLTMNCDTNIHSDFNFDLVLVIAGKDVVSYLSRHLVAWLNNLYTHGVALGAFDNATFALAEAGLLNGRRATIHWETIRIFSERFPDCELVECRYLMDGNIMTCAGGIATLDMMLDYLEREHGPTLARQVADGFVHPNPQPGSAPQRLIMEPEMVHMKDDVSKAIEIMEETIEAPLSVEKICDQLGVARRNLERMFRRKTQSSIAKYYMRVRLERARELLLYGEESIADISVICGFSSPAVFSRSFRAHVGQTPGEFRSSYSAAEVARFRPHVTWSLNETRRYRT